MFLSSTNASQLLLPCVLWSGDALVTHRDGSPDEWVRRVQVEPGPPKVAYRKPSEPQVAARRPDWKSKIRKLKEEK
jgi:hypothetical protein